MESNKVITFAFLIIALFYKQNPIAKITLNRKVKQTGKLQGIFSSRKADFCLPTKNGHFDDVS